MPDSSEILAGLGQIANDAFALAVVWHAVVAGTAVALQGGVRPPRRIAALWLAAPLASVSLLAFAYDNPFNGVVFALLGVAIAALGLRGPGVVAETAGVATRTLGFALIAFGWVYPHFLEGRSLLAYLYGAPLGLLPCPTLSLVIGFALVERRGVAGRAAGITLSVAGAFYALLGALRLGVAIDLVLLVGALGLLAKVTRPVDRAPRAWRPRTPASLSGPAR